MADTSTNKTVGVLTVFAGMETIAENLFAFNGLVTMMPGMTVPARMVVLRQPATPPSDTARLVVYSPFAPSLVDVTPLGTVEAVVAPGPMHSMYAQDFQAAHPGARLYSSPVLQTRFPERDWGTLVDHDTSEDVLGPDVRLRFVRFLQEVVLYHAPSQSLVAADLAFNLSPSSMRHASWTSRMLVRLLGGDRLDWSASMRLLMKAHCDGALPELDALLVELPWERFVPCHGEVCTDAPKEAFRQGVYCFVEGVNKGEESNSRGRLLVYGAVLAVVVGIVLAYRKWGS